MPDGTEGELPLYLPISFEDQEILCSNCYETIPMALVDKHSIECSEHNAEMKKQMAPKKTMRMLMTKEYCML